MKKKTETGLKKKKTFPIRVVFAAFFFFIETLCLIALVYFAVTLQVLSSFWWVPIIVLFVIDFILSIFILNTKVQVDFKLSWLVVIIILPFGGALLYLLFANKITTKKKKQLRFNKINKYLSYSK